MNYLEERIEKLLCIIDGLSRVHVEELNDIYMSKAKSRIQGSLVFEKEKWEKYDKNHWWGGHREYYAFYTEVEIPRHMDGKCVYLEVTTGREGRWDATNPQFLLYINGEIKQGLDVNHTQVLMAKKAEYGKQYSIMLSAFTGEQNYDLKLGIKLIEIDEITESFYFDVQVPFEAIQLIDKSALEYIEGIQVLNDTLNRIDLRDPYSYKYYESLKCAKEYLQAEFFDKLCGDKKSTVYCVGHTHIDIAWKWTLEVTRDKVVRSFSTVLELMDRYPEFRFMSSQAQLYQYVKEEAPSVYKRIQEKVKEGRWEVEGAMFVEADCNLCSGESLVRQILFGKRFFQKEFAQDNKILWLPDVFGYSAALPQIMNKSGLAYFMTTKISWNDTNKMPMDTFYWEGIDGSQVLSHFIPTQEHPKSKKKKSKNYEKDYYTTYNGKIDPAHIKGGWERYSQKNINREVLNAFGFGDGGGGPTREMLEYFRRLEKGLPDCPTVKMSSAKEFFEELKANVKDNKHLPKWVGELYLEYHRGTYTSMARNKKMNRRGEYLCQNIELWNSMDMLLNQSCYPQSEINQLWEILLRNQFHDILPGSSIKEVYDDSDREYQQLFDLGGKLFQLALNKIAEEVDAKKNSLIVFNANSYTESECTKFFLEENKIVTGLLRQGRVVPVQRITKNEYIFEAEDIPSKGYTTMQISDKEHGEVNHGIRVTKEVLENDFYEIHLNEKGQIQSLFDKDANRELIQAGRVMNRFVAYEDRPHNFDAWDINDYYTEKSWEVNQLISLKVVEEGPVRGGIEMMYQYENSWIRQRIYLYRRTKRIDFSTEIDWKEEHILLKALFPMDMHAQQVSVDTQFGFVNRATHKNTSWDRARFEMCMHKWIDLSEGDYGVAILNDSKYGFSIDDNIVGISLIKSATDPNPIADQELHNFIYSIYPHYGNLQESKVVEEAYKINNALTIIKKETEGGSLPRQMSFVVAEHENIIIEVVKKADEDNAIVIRAYEAYNRRTETKLRVGFPIKRGYECNLLESIEKELSVTEKEIICTFTPFEIKTIRIEYV